jgi:hypothetical protein
MPLRQRRKTLRKVASSCIWYLTIYVVRVNLPWGWVVPKAEHFPATALSGARRGTDTMIGRLPLDVFVKVSKHNKNTYLSLLSLSLSSQWEYFDQRCQGHPLSMF